jgi:hypothetical protein
MGTLQKIASALNTNVSQLFEVGALTERQLIGFVLLVATETARKYYGSDEVQCVLASWSPPTIDNERTVWRAEVLGLQIPDKRQVEISINRDGSDIKTKMISADPNALPWD